MKKSFKSNQRYHRRRDVIVPHGQMCGLMLTVNPMQADRAFREAESYLNTLTKELQQACKALTNKENDQSESHTSTSALLAAELEDAIAKDQQSRKRSREETDVKSTWFTSIETSCKGYLLLRVPMINPTMTCVAVTTGTENNDANENKGHTILINPLVSIIVEKIFNDLSINPRPIFRHCFRLLPAELTCCPTLPEMTAALKELINKHYPTEKRAENTALSLKFDEPISFPNSRINQRSLTTVLFRLSVKNNTKVQEAYRQFEETLLKLFPLNRFTVLSRETIPVETAFVVSVMHSTCIMGVQRCYSNRSSYNLNEIGKQAFQLSQMLHADK